MAYLTKIAARAAIAGALALIAIGPGLGVANADSWGPGGWGGYGNGPGYGDNGPGYGWAGDPGNGYGGPGYGYGGACAWIPPVVSMWIPPVACGG